MIPAVAPAFSSGHFISSEQGVKFFYTCIVSYQLWESFKAILKKQPGMILQSGYDKT
jgi:hypothetical protein